MNLPTSRISPNGYDTRGIITHTRPLDRECSPLLTLLKVHPLRIGHCVPFVNELSHSHSFQSFGDKTIIMSVLASAMQSAFNNSGLSPSFHCQSHACWATHLSFTTTSFGNIGGSHPRISMILFPMFKK